MNNFTQDKYYVFGAGSTAKMCKRTLEKNNKNVVSFLTSNNSLVDIDNVPVINLSTNNIEFDLSIPVIIGVFNRETNANMGLITEYLTNLKFKHIINFYDFFNEYSSQIDNLYWLTNRKYYLENVSKIHLVKELFKEQRSCDIFDQIINFLRTFDINFLPISTPKDQYFPDGLNVWDGNNAFLDIGSFDGQSILDAYNKYGTLETAIAYEPDPVNITLINSKFSITNPAKHIFLIPCGVWSKTEILKFSSGTGESSAIQSEGDISIQCLSLDETLFGVIPGYIKMDIEGAEYEALKGSEKIIKKYKPTLAICLYHRPDHLFEIPLLIKSWDLGYDYYIRPHGNNLLETVLYCIPNKLK